MLKTRSLQQAVRHAAELRKAYVVGVGMTKFEKPGRRIDFCYPDMARESGTAALKDAGLTFDQIEHASVGYCYGDSTSGQRAVYELGITGIPIYNVSRIISIAQWLI